MAESLTPIERKVYQYLIDFLAENTYQPSIREIGKKFRIKSTKTVSDLLHSLSAKGYIERDPSRSRGVRIVGYTGPSAVQPVPVYGSIGALGAGGLDVALLAPERRTSVLNLDRRFVASEDAFFVQAEGDQLAARGILDGDYVMISPSIAPRGDDVIAVRLASGTALRPLVALSATSMTLAGATPDEPPQVVLASETGTILGVVCGVVRPYVDRATFDGAIST
jgi:repressor LexA